MGCGASTKQRPPLREHLREYFEKRYRQGGQFRHPDYIDVFDATLHTWLHLPTGIQVWQDAIDLSSGDGGQVFFHYTSELAFRNITAPSKQAAEVWASLNSDPGPKQNAWWGKGVYSVPLPPDQWQSRHQLLDNNFRNMMARDRAAPNKGPEYVQEEYPKRVAFCVPILIHAADAYDVSVRATPEMEAAGKAPGVNLGNKLLNEPGMPPRCCVVLRVNGEDGVKHAQGQLLDVLRRRAATSTDKERLGLVLRHRGLHNEALPILQEVLEICESSYGPESQQVMASMHNLATVLWQLGRYQEALGLQRRSLKGCESILGPEHRDTLTAMNNLGGSLNKIGKYGEALEVHRKTLEICIRTLGAEDPATLMSMDNLGLVLCNIDCYREAAEIQQNALEIAKRTLGEQHPFTLASMRNVGYTLGKTGLQSEAAELQRKALEMQENTLGAEHPNTLDSVTSLGITLTNCGNCAEAEQLHRRALAVRERTVGAEHPDTLESLSELAVSLHRLDELNEALELQRRAVSGREKILGPDHPETQKTRQRLEEVLLAWKEAEMEKDEQHIDMSCT